ncbi:MAG: hypothetical protein LBN04_12360 [Oscillospiraceae bacterium]|jgi:type II secretory pathway pseudopilin PulG|nr:hypothetical protein [Oscillospiraceae bacterium]
MMFLRRLLSLLLVLLCLLPQGAFAQPIFSDVAIEYEMGIGQDGMPITTYAQSSLNQIDGDFYWRLADDGSLTIHTINGFAPARMRVMLVYVDSDTYSQTLYTAQAPDGSQWIDAAALAYPQMLSFLSEDGSQAITQPLAITNQPAPGVQPGLPEQPIAPPSQGMPPHATDYISGLATGLALYDSPDGQLVQYLGADQTALLTRNAQNSQLDGRLWIEVYVEGYTYYLPVDDAPFIDEATYNDMNTPDAPPQQTMPAHATAYLSGLPGGLALYNSPDGQPALYLGADQTAVLSGNMQNSPLDGRLWIEVHAEGGSYYLPVDDAPFIDEATYTDLITPDLPTAQTLPPHATAYISGLPGGLALYNSPDGQPALYLGADQTAVLSWEMQNSPLDGRLWIEVYAEGGTYFLPVDSAPFIDEATYTDLNTPEPPPIEQQSLSPDATMYLSGTADLLPLYNEMDGQPVRYLGADQTAVLTGNMQNSPLDGRLWMEAEVEGSRYYLPQDGAPFIDEATYIALNTPDPTPEPLPDTFESLYLSIGQEGTSLYDWPDETPNYPLSPGDVVRYAAGEADAFLNGADMALWLRVRYKTPGGETLDGYIKYRTARVMSAEEAAAYVVAQREPMPARESSYLRVQGQGAYLYDSPNGNQGAPINGGEVLTFLENDGNATAYDDSDGSLWLYVELGDQHGYVKMSSVSFLTAGEAFDWEHPPEVMPDITSDYLRIREGGAALYDAPGGNKLSDLSPNDVVAYQFQDNNAQRYDGNNELWLLVQSQNGQSGYLKLQNASFLSQSEAWDHENPLPTPQSLYATVRNDGTPVLAPDGRQVEQAQAGQVVRYQQGSQSPADSYVDQGGRWMLVRTQSGQIGYINLGSIAFMTPQQEQDYLASQNVTPDPLPLPRYGVVTSPGVRVLQQPGGAAFATLAYDAKVLLQERVVFASTGVEYYLVNLENERGEMGYVPASQIRPMTDQEQRDYIQNRPTPTPLPTASATPLPTASPLPTPPTEPAEPSRPPQMKGYMRSIVQNAPMLQWPDYGGLPLGALDYGDVVLVWEQVYDISGNTWHYGLWENQWGYIQASYLTAMTPAEVDDHFKNQAQPTAPPVAKPTPGTDGMSGYAMLTGDNVNFRTGPSTNDSRIARLPQRTLVRVMDSVVRDGVTWYYCESNGRYGYLHGDYISMLTVREYLLLVSSPSYDQNGNVITPTATAKPGGGIVVATQRPGASNQITFVTIPPMSTVLPSPTPLFTPSPSPDPYATPTATAPGVFFPGGMTTPTPPLPDTSATPAASATFPTQETSTFTPPTLMLALVVLLILAGGGLYGYSVYNRARRKQAEEQAQRLAAEARRKARQQELGVVGGRPAPKPQQNPYARPQAPPAPRAHVDGKPVEAPPPQTRPSESAKAYMRPAAPAKPQDAPSVEGMNPAQERPARTRMPVAPPPVLPEEELPTPRRRRYNPDQPKEGQGTDQQKM